MNMHGMDPEDFHVMSVILTMWGEDSGFRQVFESLGGVVSDERFVEALLDAKEHGLVEFLIGPEAFGDDPDAEFEFTVQPTSAHWGAMMS